MAEPVSTITINLHTGGAYVYIGDTGHPEAIPTDPAEGFDPEVWRDAIAELVEQAGLVAHLHAVAHGRAV